MDNTWLSVSKKAGHEFALSLKMDIKWQHRTFEKHLIPERLEYFKACVATEPCSQLHGRYTQRRRQYVTPILRPQKFGKSKPLPHRWLSISVTLPSHGYGSTGIYLHSNNEAIHRSTYYVRTYKRNTKRCA